MSICYCHITNNNPDGYTWFDWLESGLKTYEGRLNNGKWKLDFEVLEVKCDTDGRNASYMVLKKETFKDFNEAFERLGEQMIPIGLPDNKKDANELYESFGYKPEDIKKYGVVCVHLKKI